DGAGPPDAPAGPGAEGQATGGHPVDVITGTVFTDPVRDFLMCGPLTLPFRRGYSTSSVRRNVGLGWGWAHNLAWEATLKGDVLRLVDPEGRERVAVIESSDQTIALPFGGEARVVGDEIAIANDDGYFYVLRRADDSGKF